MVERILSMLTQFLISNQSLQINKSFKVYVKILSINHMASRETRHHIKRNKLFYKNLPKKKHYGSKEEKKKSFNYYWALDVPNSLHGEPSDNFFKNKCLLVCTALGFLQHHYFENNKNKKFLQIKNAIKSNNLLRQKRAAQIIVEEISKIITAANLPESGPYEAESTFEILSSIYKCQFIIFNSIANNRKLLCMYPKEYDDTLKPIYLYQPNTESNHLIYIQKLSSFYGANFRICFACKKLFKTRSTRAPWHSCPQKHSCFACRRFYATNNTYLNESLVNNFCDKNLTSDLSFSCQVCNVTIFSNNCFKNHQRLCSKSGHFGYYCEKCQKFTYCQTNSNSSI